MKSRLTTCFSALAILLVAAMVHADDQRKTPPKTSIPEIASIAKVRIGYSSQEDLAKQWGEGKERVGGHPNSGRDWRVKGTRWILSTDGFDYSKRGLVVDQFSLYESPKQADDLPYAKLSKKDFLWLGEIAPGMAKHHVMQILKRKSLTVTPTKDGYEIRARGFMAFTSISAALRSWQATLSFANDSLSTLHLYASVDLKP